MSSLNVLYYDDSAKDWILRRPNTSLAKPTVPVVVIAVGKTDADQAILKIAEILKSNQPVFTLLIEVTPHLHTLLRSSAAIRASYGITDLKNVAPHNMLDRGRSTTYEHGSCILVSNGVPVMHAETSLKGERPMVTIHSRSFFGHSLFVAAAHFDPLNLVTKRADSVSDRLSTLESSDVSIVFANFFETLPQQDLSMRQDLVKNVKSPDWQNTSDLVDGGPDTRTGPYALWIRQSGEHNKIAVQSVTKIPSESFSFVAAVQIKVSTPASPVVIPQPRSAKADPGRVSPKNGPTDPAGGGIPPHTLPPATASAPRRTWSFSSTYFILRHVTREYDGYVQSQFESPDDAISALNSGKFSWDFDYLIVRSTLIACDAVRAAGKISIQQFKRYVMENAPRMSQYTRNNRASNASQRQQSGAGGADTSSSGSATEGGGGAAREVTQSTIVRTTGPRVWSAHSWALTYSITPMDLMFDITSQVKEGGVASAVDRLNKKVNKSADKDKPDPLAVYQYPYAILHSPERQGYLLLASTDVPCDILACREYARENRVVQTN